MCIRDSDRANFESFVFIFLALFIYFYQNNSKIKLFVATDMEGYWNPFNNFYNSSSFGDINSREESYNLGKEHGKILNELGFNLDF